MNTSFLWIAFLEIYARFVLNTSHFYIKSLAEPSSSVNYEFLSLKSIFRNLCKIKRRPIHPFIVLKGQWDYIYLYIYFIVKCNLDFFRINNWSWKTRVRKNNNTMLFCCPLQVTRRSPNPSSKRTQSHRTPSKARTWPWHAERPSPGRASPPSSGRKTMWWVMVNNHSVWRRAMHSKNVEQSCAFRHDKTVE